MIRGRGARLGLLRAAPDFRLLFFATLASSIGTWLAFVALVIDVFDRTEDASWVSALLIVEFLPIVAVGLFAGPLIDRLPRRSIMIAADLARGAVFFALPLVGTALQIVLLAAAAGVATSFFRPAVYAGLPNVVADEELPRANGLLQAADNFTWAIGSLVGGVLVAASGPELAYWINGATFVASALLLARIRGSLEHGERSAAEPLRRQLAEGLALVRGSAPLLAVLVAWSAVMLASAGVNVAEVVLAKEAFGAGDFGFGLLVAATAVGLVLGSLVGGDWIERRGARTPYGISIVLMAGGYGAAAAAPNVWVAAVLVSVAGCGNGIAVICNSLLVQRGAPDRLRGRAFSVIISANYAVLGLGMVIAGPATNVLGARAVWGIAAGLCAAGAVVGYALLRGVEPQPAEEPYAAEPGKAL